MRAGREQERDTVRLRAWEEPEGKNVIYCEVEGLGLGRESSFRVSVSLGARQHVQS